MVKKMLCKCKQIDKLTHLNSVGKKQVYFIILPPHTNLRSSSSPKIHFYCYFIFMYYILDTAI